MLVAIFLSIAIGRMPAAARWQQYTCRVTTPEDRLEIMLTIAQRSEFDRLGILGLPGVIPSADVERMRERLWTALSRQHGVLREAPETWTDSRPAHFQSLVRSGAFAPMASGPVC